jgi:hypothetical protein
VVRCTIAALLVALVAGGCGLGDRQHRADAIIDSVDHAFAAGSASGTLSTSTRFVRVPDGAGAALGGGGTPGSTADAAKGGPIAPAAPDRLPTAQQAFTTGIALDLARGRATIALPRSPTAPFAIFSNLVAYGRRWSAGPRDARPWVRVDASDLNEGDELDPTQDAPQLFAFAVNPVYLIDLIAGPLAGSVRDKGSAEVAGVATTHYAANFDIDKVTRHTRRRQFPEDTRKAFDDVLDVLAVSGRIHPGDVWVDAQGRPRRFSLRLKEEPIRHFVIEHTITVELTSFGGGKPLDVPSPQQRVEVRSLVQYVRATIPSPRTPEFLTFLGVPAAATPPATTTVAAGAGA